MTVSPPSAAGAWRVIFLLTPCLLVSLVAPTVCLALPTLPTTSEAHGDHTLLGFVGTSTWRDAGSTALVAHPKWCVFAHEPNNDVRGVEPIFGHKLYWLTVVFVIRSTIKLACNFLGFSVKFL